MYWMQAITPVHVGTGSQIEFVDLPIAREKATDWPVVPGSGIKGVMSDHFKASRPDQRRNDPLLRAAFGAMDPKSPDEAANSGALVYTNARMVCLPVRSVFGTFAFATCHMALVRLGRDLNAAECKLPGIVPEPKGDEGILTPTDPKTALADKDGKHIYLADLDFPCTASTEAKAWADALAAWIFPDDNEWAAAFKQRFAVLDDDTFNYFSRTGTEITTRVRIDPDTKTVAGGQLWTEEALPAESLLAGMVWCDKLFHKGDGKTEAEVLQHFCREPLSLQVGGKATVGRGRVRMSFSRQEVAK